MHMVQQNEGLNVLSFDTFGRGVGFDFLQGKWDICKQGNEGKTNITAHALSNFMYSHRYNEGKMVGFDLYFYKGKG